MTQYTYDSLGHLTSFTDANGNTTAYTYDSLSGVTQITYPDATVETFSYDSIGNLVQRTDSNGITFFIYNAVYQLIETVYPDSTATTFNHDANGNRTLIVDSAGETTYTYDNRNRVLSKTRTIEGESYTVTYMYDAVSNLVSMTYPDQSVITYEYDPLNRLTAISGYAQFFYNSHSFLSNTVYANGVTADYQYDNRDRPVSIHAAKEGTDLLLMGYQYDPVGNITQLEYDRIKDGQWEQSLENFSYDWLDRLVSVQGSSGSSSYSYDPTGNRITLNDLTYTYNNMNELTSISDGTVFTYDDMGNTISKSSNTDIWSYAYNTKNQLVQVEKDQELRAEYNYDWNDRRIKKTEWIEDLQEYHTKIYVYDGLRVLYGKNLNTGQEATYMYGSSGRIAKKVSGLIDYYHTDHLGSTRLVTDEQGNVVSEVQYKAFGKTDEEEEDYLFTGKERDSSGLYYYGARYYDPEIGRFISRDPRFEPRSVCFGLT